MGFGCKVTSQSVTMTERSAISNITSSSKAWHAKNVIVLQHFYDTSNVSITGRTLMTSDDKLQPERVDWKVYGEKVNTLLAADDTAAYSLKKLAASLQNDYGSSHSSRGYSF